MEEKGQRGNIDTTLIPLIEGSTIWTSLTTVGR